MSPPRLATWLLGWLEGTCSPLVGDLHEEWQHGRSAGWFWRQTMSVLYGRAARYAAEHRPLALLGLVAIGLYWVGTHVPLPGVNTDALAPVTRHGQFGLPGQLGLYDLFTGGNLGRGTIFALGIMPYVTALFIAYLATELGFARGWGARGRRALAWSVRSVALVLGVVQAMAIAIWLEQQTALADGLPVVAQAGWSFRLTLVLTVTTITACLIWLSDEIGRRGMGWGVSLRAGGDGWKSCTPGSERVRAHRCGSEGRGAGVRSAGCRIGHPGTDAGRLHRSPRARGIRRGPALELGARRARRSGPVVVPAWECRQQADEVLRPFREAAERLTTIPGVSETVARVLVAEIGVDMTRFPGPGHLVSWAGLCPRLDESTPAFRQQDDSGRRQGCGTPGTRYCRRHCILAAESTRFFVCPHPCRFVGRFASVRSATSGSHPAQSRAPGSSSVRILAGSSVASLRAQRHERIHPARAPRR